VTNSALNDLSDSTRSFLKRRTSIGLALERLTTLSSSEGVSLFRDLSVLPFYLMNGYGLGPDFVERVALEAYAPPPTRTVAQRQRAAERAIRDLEKAGA